MLPRYVFLITQSINNKCFYKRFNLSDHQTFSCSVQVIHIARFPSIKRQYGEIIIEVTHLIAHFQKGLKCKSK